MITAAATSGRRVDRTAAPWRRQARDHPGLRFGAIRFLNEPGQAAQNQVDAQDERVAPAEEAKTEEQEPDDDVGGGDGT